MNERDELLRRWADKRFTDFRMIPASEDASFRRYFRVETGGKSLIVMDAPPALENSERFVAVARAFSELGLKVPEIHEADLEMGFLILEDFGIRPYLYELSTGNADELYGDALAALSNLQLLSRDRVREFPAYDHAMLEQELLIFDEWFLGHHLGISLADAELSRLRGVYERLIESALEQPVVWVHRDFHSRNLMVLPADNPGILDFQGAVSGPVTYDLVSLLRDCYIRWPHANVERWALDYRARLEQSGFHGLGEPDRFLRWFDLMGLQRHLKVAGIFARLFRRDGKPGYLGDIPRTLDYVLEVCRRRSELTDLRELIEQRVIPAISRETSCAP